MLIGEALRDRRDKVFIQVKFGGMRGPDGTFIGQDTRPVAVKNFLAYTLKRLGTNYIDLYQPARVAPDVPIEDTVGAIAEMVEAGYVRHIGLSEAGAETIRRAHKVHPITSLQIEYSLMSRSIEKEILPAVRELGIGLTVYGILSRGLLSGHWSPERSKTGHDFRTFLPRFQGENLKKNLQLVEALRKIALKTGVSTAQLAIAWVLHRGDDIVPLIGARRIDQLNESLKALDIVLSDDDMAQIEAAVPSRETAGTRYGGEQMAWLDSERS
jgi:aryl-alcohol dehydrogenase-like predicted oxidoreductase